MARRMLPVLLLLWMGCADGESTSPAADAPGDAASDTRADATGDAALPRADGDTGAHDTVADAPPPADGAGTDAAAFADAPGLADAADAPDAPAPPDAKSADAASSEDAADAPDSAASPVCCTDAWCAAVGATGCDPACHCTFPEPCCNDSVCTAVDAVCNLETCRCEPVPCSAPGAPCALPPGTPGDGVCLLAGSKAQCHRVVPDPSHCPAGGCVGLPPPAQGCVCSLDACAYFLDECPDGTTCAAPKGAAGVTSLACILHGPAQEGDPCNGGPECDAELLCLEVATPYLERRCVRPGCGVVEGAPSCPDGSVCRPLDALGLYGACRALCDPLDDDGPCAPDEVCAPLCGPPGSGAACGVPGGPPLGALGGLCEPSGTGVAPPVGAPCPNGACAPGAFCLNGRCMQACSPGAEAPAPGSCPASNLCSAVPDAAGAAKTVCAAPCNLWGDGAPCPGGDLCAPVPGGGRCLPPGPYAAGVDEPCNAGPPYACGSGLGCAPLAPVHTATCRPLCLASAGPGEEGACPPGERCFRMYGGMDPGWSPYGTCGVACDPFAESCPPGLVCEPLDREPSGALVGQCFYADSGAPGQPCKSADPGWYHGCAPGLTCTPSPSGASACRPQCDPQSEVTGVGACEPGTTCTGAWPPGPDAVAAGCVPD